MILVEASEDEEALGTRGHRWEDNTKMWINESFLSGCGVEWTGKEEGILKDC
jgi:hypothetical protein